MFNNTLTLNESLRFYAERCRPGHFFGALKCRGDAWLSNRPRRLRRGTSWFRRETAQGYEQVLYELAFENGSLEALVTFGRGTNKVAGLFIRPIGSR